MNIEFTPPIRGINKGFPSDKSLPGFSEYMNNVRPAGFEKKVVITQRLGLDKWSTDQVGNVEYPVVAMCTVSTVA